MREDCVLLVLLFCYVDLDELEDVSSNSFHRFDQHVVCLIHADQFRNLRRVNVVDLQQIIEDVAEVEEVGASNTLSHSLVDLDHLVNGLNVLEVKY